MAFFAMFTSLSGAYAQENATGWTLNIDADKANPVTAGTLVNIAAKVDNSSNGNLPKTTVEFVIPKSSVFVGATGFDKCTPSAESETPLKEDLTVVCEVPELLPYEQSRGNIQIKPQKNGVVDFAGIVKGNDFDEALTITVVEGADLALKLKLDEKTVSAGSTTKFTAEITNNGPHASKESILTFTVPEGLKLGDLPNGCALNNNRVQCKVGDIAVSQSIPLEFTAQVITNNQSHIDITAQIEGLKPLDPDEDSNEDKDRWEVIAGTDVGLRKERSPFGSLIMGDDVEFKLTPQFSGYEPQTAQIVDDLPEYYGDISVVPANSGWSCGVVGQKVTCDYVAIDGSKFDAPIIIKAKAVKDSKKKTVTNRAIISSPDETSNNKENNIGEDVGVEIEEPITDLAAHKGGPTDGLMLVGESYEYSLHASNNGNIDFSDTITITDILPAGMKVTNVAAIGWSCVPLDVEGPASLTCTSDQYKNGPPLKPGDTTSPIKLTVEITAAASTVPGGMSNVMKVTFPEWEAIEPKDRHHNNTVTFGGTAGEPNTPVPSVADLAIEKSIIATDPIMSGDEVEFQIKLYNNGPAKATGVVITDHLEPIVGTKEGGDFAGITPVITIPASSSVTIPSGACKVTGKKYAAELKCEKLELPVCKEDGDACAIISFKVRQGTDGERTNTASIYSTETPDNNSTNNKDKVNYTVVPENDVTVTKTVDSDTARAGQNLVYRIAAKVLHPGLSAAENVTITDFLPHGARFVSADPSIGRCSTVPDTSKLIGLDNDELTCDFGTIGAGSQETVLVTIKPTNAQINNPLTNKVSVTTSIKETNTDNNSSEVTVTVAPPSFDLIIEKTDNQGGDASVYDPVEKTEKVIYTITATNAGPSDAYNIVITDTLPKGGFHTPVVIEKPNALKCEESDVVADKAGGKIICTAPELAAGDKIQFKVEMTSFQLGTFNNGVEIKSDEFDYETQTKNNIANEKTTVRGRSDVGVKKKPVKDVVDLREEFSWDIHVTSHLPKEGPAYDIAEDVRIQDNLPFGMVLTRAPEIIEPKGSLARCTGVAGGTSFECFLGDMAPGTKAHVLVHTKITSKDATAAKNTVTVTTKTFDKNPENDASTGSVTTVLGGSISGKIFTDFNENGEFNKGQDVGVDGLSVTLNGTARDGTVIKPITVRTGTDGTYEFSDLAPGIYEVTYTAPDGKKYNIGGAYPDASTTTGQVSGKQTINKIEVKSAAGAKEDSKSENNNFTLHTTPSIGLSKVAGTSVDKGDGTYSVDYTFTIKNLSQEPVVDVALSDTLNGSKQNFGTYSSSSAPAEGHYSILSVSSNSGMLNSKFNGAGNDIIVSNATIKPDATLTAIVTVLINPVKPWVSLPLVLSNQATVNANGEYSGKPVKDLSDKKPGGENDPKADEETVVEIGSTAKIELKKTAELVLAGAEAVVGDRINYTFEVTNTGNTPLFDVKIEDLLPDLVWDENTSIDRLEVGATNDTAFKAHYLLKQEDIDSGLVKNTAKTIGKWADNGGNPETVEAEADAEVTLTGKPGLSILKEALFDGNEPPSVVGDVITYKFTVTNTGNLTLSDVVVEDPLPGLDMPVKTIAKLLPGSAYAQTLEATYAITQADIEKGKVVNKAIAKGDYTDPVTKQPEPVDPAESEEIVVPLGQKPAIAVVKKAESKLTEPAEVGQEIVYHFTVHNTGNMVLNNVVLTDPLPGITPSSFDVGTLQPGEKKDYSASYHILEADIDAGEVINQATAKGVAGDPTNPKEVTDLSGPDIEKDEPVIVPIVPPSPEDVRITKQAMLHQVRRGDRVPYIIKVENLTAKHAGFVNVIDTMPSGFRYVSETATVDGVATEPEISGRRLQFKNMKLGPNGVIEIRLELLVLSSAGPGKHANIATVTDKDGNPVAPDAHAIVEIMSEPVFDCGEIIGTVFDDRNRNGYQDEGEKGLAGVRVATVKGWLITTDEYGRFHVPCAALPDQRIGSNFIMKLDTRTLPTGYRLTTENPRVVRLTAGKMTKLNFGASISRVVRLDLQDAAFEANRVELKKQWADNLPQLVEILKQEISVLRLSYKMAGNEQSLAKERMKHVRKQITDLWKRKGDNYPLEIETRVEVSK
ncbi:DUF7507 domain-containing protein [Paenochrobactrum glaciei]